MRPLAIILLLVALGLAGFGVWGTETVAGRAAYDEMAGIVPFFAGMTSPFLAVVALLLKDRGRRGAGTSS